MVVDSGGRGNSKSGEETNYMLSGSTQFSVLLEEPEVRVFFHFLQKFSCGLYTCPYTV